MKILLVGEYYSENLGDPLLCQTVEAVLREAYPQAQIVPMDMTGKTGITEFYPVEKDPTRQGFWRIFFENFHGRRETTICRLIEEDRERHLRVWYRLDGLIRQHGGFDLVVFAGGSLFMDYFAGVIYLIVKRFALSGTKIIFHACGMSRLYEESTYVLGQALRGRKVASITLRDSMERFESLFSPRVPVGKTGDTALNSWRYYPAAEKKVAEYGIGLIDRCYDEQIELVKSCMASGVNWKAFTNGSPYDQSFAEALLRDAGISEEEIPQYLLPRPTTTGELVQIVTGFERIVAFRMHCQIVAASFGIPSFGIVWDEKVAAFYESIGFSQGCARQVPEMKTIADVLDTYSDTVRENARHLAEDSRESLLRAVEQALK